MWGASWYTAPDGRSERVPKCGNCGQDVPDVPASAAEHAIVYCSEWCALAGHRNRSGPPKPWHITWER